ncbi:MAG: protein kinase [Oscillatoria princeps RMCB-10]|jgi:serine/threonine protein kinase|nr:protein kinase [Oscillatoria princeps RMCB-10]
MIQPGQILQNRYRVIRRLGEGGCGATFEVDDAGTLKVLKVLLLDNFDEQETKEKAIALFQQEARVLSRLAHAGIPKVEPDAYFTWAEAAAGTQHCLVMEKIEGHSLREWLQENPPISQERAISWLKQLAEILREVHQQEYFHRDIKPANIMLKPDGQLVLIDFGAVRQVTGTYLAKMGVGREGTQILSPGYTPVEQYEARAVPQSDFFALGRTFVHLLTGSHPLDFPKNERQELLWREGAPAVRSQLADLIDDMMALLPGNRPQNAKIILQRLDAAGGAGVPVSSPAVEPVSHPPNPGSKVRRFGPVGVNFKLVASVLVGLGWLWVSSPQIAFALNESGQKNYLEKRYESAEFKFRLALLFKRDISMTHYNLGATCEKLGNYDCARSEHQKAIEGNDTGTPYAMNNLGRLYITQYSDNEAAIKLLERGLPLTKDESLKSDLHKNIGWVYVRETGYASAKLHLEKAIELNPESAPAHCLLAQVLEAEGNTQGAGAEWKKCQNADPKDQRPEVYAWRDLASRRLAN